jgi:3-oxoacyl-[acyl-carrier-protein] synthase II
MEAYIRSAAAITPQDSFDEALFASGLKEQTGDWLRCAEPEYKEYINPALIRRMSRIVKMGVATAVKCMKEGGVENPGAIITATGLGCMEDTGAFLHSIVANKEQFLTPTAFIQSTHNTIGGQIALMIKCHNYNLAYVHRGFSFEGALLDAMMMLGGQEADNILLGGIDEITNDYYNITRRLGMWKRQNPGALRLLEDKTSGTVAGEGAVFFMLQKKAEGAFARFRAVDMIFQPENTEAVSVRIQEMLDRCALGPEDIDAVLLGYNGWPRYDAWYHGIAGSLFPETALLSFKPWCGEYMTASSFAAWLGAGIIRHQKAPEQALVGGRMPGGFKNILIYNHFMGVDHTLMLISA